MEKNELADLFEFGSSNGNNNKVEEPETEELSDDTSSDDTSDTTDLKAEVADEGDDTEDESVETPIVQTEDVSEDEEVPAELTHREKLLLARLEEVTGERLSVDSKGNVQKTDNTIVTEVLDFIGEQDIEDVLNTKEGLNGILNMVYKMGLEAQDKRTKEILLQEIPNAVTVSTTRQIALNRMVDNFYRTNKDLVNVKRTVTSIANEISMEHPEYTVDQTLAEAATRTRKRLRLPIPGNNTKTEGKVNAPLKTNPGFTKQSARRKGAEITTTSVEKQLAELLDI